MIVDWKDTIEGGVKAILNFLKEVVLGVCKNIKLRSNINFVEDQYRCMWVPATATNGEPAMQIMTAFYATNTSEKPIKLLSVRLLKPKVKNKHIRSILLMVHRESNSAHHGIDMPVMPGQTGLVDATFFVDPPTKKRGESLIVRLAIKDQYGKEHKTQKIKIDFRG